MKGEPWPIRLAGHLVDSRRRRRACRRARINGVPLPCPHKRDVLLFPRSGEAPVGELGAGLEAVARCQLWEGHEGLHQLVVWDRWAP